MKLEFPLRNGKEVGRLYIHWDVNCFFRRYLRQLEDELARVRAGNSQPETVEEPMVHNENVDISSYAAASPISSLEQTGSQKTQAEG